jgi:hypothetical protein
MSKGEHEQGRNQGEQNADIRAPWERPALRRLAATEAQSGGKIHHDKGAFQSG